MTRAGARNVPLPLLKEKRPWSTNKETSPRWGAERPHTSFFRLCFLTRCTIRATTPTNTARVTERIDNDVPTGAVYIDGKTWSARSSSGESIEPDTMVRVVRMEGVKLYVEAEKEA